MALAVMASGSNERALHPFFTTKPGKLDKDVLSPCHCSCEIWSLDKSNALLGLPDSPRKRQRTDGPISISDGGSNEDSSMGQRTEETIDGPDVTISALSKHSPGNISPANANGLSNNIDEQVERTNDPDAPILLCQPPELETAYNTGDTAVPSTTQVMPPHQMLRVRPDGRLKSPKSSKVLESAFGHSKPPSSRTTPHPQVETTSVMLKFGSDGRLGTTREISAADSSKAKRKRGRPRGASQPPPSLLVVIRYGENNESRMSLGRQLGMILSGQERHQITPPCPRAGPMKPTHPFFLPGAGKPDGGKFSATGKSNSLNTPNLITSSASPSKLTSPKKSRVTSKPPGTIDSHPNSSSKIFPAFGTDHAKITRFPGACEPIWPPYGMLNCGRENDVSSDRDLLESLQRASLKGRKLKDSPLNIPIEQSVLQRYIELASTLGNDKEAMFRMTSREFRRFRRPDRRVVTGKDLQMKLERRIHSPFSQEALKIEGEGAPEAGLNSPSTQLLHGAIQRRYTQLPDTRTAFDRFECESHDWMRKYAPKAAEEVLQAGPEAIMLRNWLQRLQVSSTTFKSEVSKSGDPNLQSHRGSSKLRRRKKRRSDELDGFVISSDEERDEMNEISEPDESSSVNCNGKRTIIRHNEAFGGLSSITGGISNAVLISGPHGCGKTAAVFAAATELGFEVFEINSGSRRSGKDLLDKVGDMTRNHLVKSGYESEIQTNDDNLTLMNKLDEKLQADIDSGRQGTVKNFFRTKTSNKSKDPKKKVLEEASNLQKQSADTKSKSSTTDAQTTKSQNQKQSLILLEEVDILFEEDKSFWATTLDLILRSKRPVVLTCSDESLLPLDEISFHAILRFSPPPERLATDYLLLVAANEGHLLSSRTVTALYCAKNSDLRASLAELNFFCQIGIGDDKGGLEWMLIDERSELATEEYKSLRVVSKNTYCAGMGWLGGEVPSSDSYRTFDQMSESYTQLWHEWSISPGTQDLKLSPHTLPNKSRDQARLEDLKHLDLSFEALSAVDVFPSSVVRHEHSIKIDAMVPSLQEPSRGGYIEGIPLLYADPVPEYSEVGESIALSLHASAKTQLKAVFEFVNSTSGAVQEIPRLVQERSALGTSASRDYCSPFIALTQEARPVLGIPRGPSISNFDGPKNTICEDLAPYVRSIVSYDVRLGEQRRQLSSLLSMTGVEGRTRTTRASRAALEGGDKANTRREKWFPQNLDFDIVLQTGGDDWQLVLQQVVNKNHDFEEEGQVQALDASERSD